MSAPRRARLERFGRRLRRLGGGQTGRTVRSGREIRDRGAVLAIVTVLLASSVFLGVAALSVDVGSLMLERRQIQNAATAVAFAAAQDCGKGTTCRPSASTYQSLANADSIDGLTTIDGLCASSALRSAYPSTTLPLCPSTPVPTPLGVCPPPPAALAGSTYIEARTSTLTSSGSLLPPIFAQAVVGGYTGTHEQACARATLGPVASATVGPIAVSNCAWNAATSGGDLTTLAPRPPYATYPAEVDLRLNDPLTLCGSSATLPYLPTIPGGFAFVRTSGLCNLTAVVGSSVPDAGSLLPTGCDLAALWKTTVIVPVYDGVTVLGQRRVARLAAFYVSGYQYGGFRTGQPSIATGAWCSPVGTDVCLSGWFTTDQVSDSAVSPSAPRSGVVAVQLSG